MLSVIYEIISPIFLAAAIGFYIGRRFHPDTRTMSTIVLQVFLPALVLGSIAETTLSPEQIGLIAVLVILQTIVMSSIGLVGAWLYRLPPTMRSSYMLGAMLANTGNYGLPVISFTFGERGLQTAVIVMVCTSIVTNTWGIYLATPRGGNPLAGVVNIFRVPTVYVIPIGLYLNFTDHTLPLPAARLVELFSGAAVPIMMLLLGIQLSRITFNKESRGTLPAVGSAVFARLLLAPVSVFLLTSLLGIGGLMQQVMILQLSMPTAVNGAVLITEFGGDPQFITTMILGSTLLSVVTLSLLLPIVL
ncbi:MAG: AEC family transporter [Anaerolineae bacterium]